jgi:hypothetical protein
MPSRVFSAGTFPPIYLRNEWQEQKKETVTRISREKYAKPIEFVENKIKEVSDKAAEDEKKFKEREAAFKERIKEEKLAKKAVDRVSGLLWNSAVDTVRVQSSEGDVFIPKPEKTPEQINAPQWQKNWDNGSNRQQNNNRWGNNNQSRRDGKNGQKNGGNQNGQRPNGNNQNGNNNRPKQPNQNGSK